VSKNMVTKLGLKTEKHPSPYKIGWIRQGAKAKVTKICRIQFSIRKNYLDEITCDVVEMDACHGSLMWMPNIKNVIMCMSL